MNEFLCDDLPEDGDGEVDADDIDATVNKWIADHAPFSWNGDGAVIRYESIVKFCEKDL